MPKIQSFDDLLDRAKRAQQAMRELNLSLIEAHDRTELAKLDHAINALAQLNQDAEPELLPAVDAPPFDFSRACEESTTMSWAATPSWPMNRSRRSATIAG